ncbi:hypothetical protein CLS_26650 [[Clostridium] cf. saccharolyticum K10]|nr:hypothetical protein CLS_26650 [[Clostridium] cf. saccharolyticum K10]
MKRTGGRRLPREQRVRDCFLPGEKGVKREQNP